MKKKLLLVALMLLLAGCVLLTACGKKTPVTPVFENVNTVYDGSAKTIAVSNLPEGSTVMYSVNGGADVAAVSVTEAGTYTVVAKVTVPKGYASVPDLTATLTVEKASLASYFSATVAYDGTYKTPAPTTALPAGVSYAVEGAPLLNAGQTGSFTINFSYADAAMANNYVASVTGFAMTVTKGTVDMSGVSFEDDTLPYDGGYKTLSLTGTLPSFLGVDISGGGFDKGSYSVTATFYFLDPAFQLNYELPAPMTATLTIGKGEFDLAAFNFSDRTVSYNGVDQFPAYIINGLIVTVSVTKDGTPVTEAKLPGTYSVSVTFAADGEIEYTVPGEKTFTITIEKGVLGGLEAPTWAPTMPWDREAATGEGYFFLESGETPNHNVAIQLPATMLDPEIADVEIVYTHTLNGVATDTLTAAGEYVTTATITFTSDLYDLPDGYELVYTYTWRVADREADTNGITYNGMSVNYTGSAFKLAATYDATAYPYITGVTYMLNTGDELVAIDGDGFIASGSYVIVAIFDTDAKQGYAPFTMEATLTIGMAAIDLTDFDFVWNYTDPFEANGSVHSVTLSQATLEALAALGVSVERYENNAFSEAGEYIATVILVCDADHELNPVTSATLNWGIAKAEDDSWSDIAP